MKRSLKSGEEATSHGRLLDDFARSILEAVRDFGGGFILGLVFCMLFVAAEVVLAATIADWFAGAVGAIMVFVITLSDPSPAFQKFRSLGFCFPICLLGAAAMADDEAASVLLAWIMGSFVFSSLVSYTFPRPS